MVEDGELISTGIDEFIKLVRARKKVELSEAANVLGIPRTRADGWAELLEREGMATLEYMFTKTYIAWKEKAATELAKTVGKVEKARVRTGQAIETLEKKLESGSHDLEKLSAMYERLNSQLVPGIDRARESLRQLETYRSKIESINANYNSELSALRSKFSGFMEELDSMEHSFEALRDAMNTQDVADIKKALAKLAEVEESLSSQLEYLSEKEKDYRERTEANKKKFGDVSDMSGYLDDITAKIKELEELKKNFELLKKANVIDVSKMDIVLRDYNRFLKQLDKNREQVSTMSSELSTLVTGVNSLKGQLDSFGDSGKELEPLVKQLESLIATVKDMDKYMANVPNYQKDLDERIGRIRQIMEKPERYKRLLDDAKTFKAELDTIDTDYLKNVDSVKSSISTVSGRIKGELKNYVDLENKEITLKEKFEGVSSRLNQLRTAYLNELGGLNNSVKELKAEYSAFNTQVAGDAEKLQALINIYNNDVSGMRGLGDAKTMLDDLKEEREVLAKEVELLKKRMAMLSMQEGRGESEHSEIAAVAERFRLTQEQEQKFKNRRAELRKILEATSWKGN